MLALRALKAESSYQGCLLLDGLAILVPKPDGSNRQN
jgi:hypothetical protein